KATDVAEQRQPVRQYARVAAAHALNTYTGGAERRRCGLHAHPAHFVQHHDDVARRHQHLLFDFFASEDLDAHRLIFESLVRARRRNDRDRLLECWLGLQIDADVLLRVSPDHHLDGHSHVTVLDDRELHLAGENLNLRRSRRVGVMARATDNDFGLLDRLFFRADLNANGAPLTLCRKRCCKKTHDHDDGSSYSIEINRHPTIIVLGWRLFDVASPGRVAR